MQVKSKLTKIYRPDWTKGVNRDEKKLWLNKNENVKNNKKRCEKPLKDSGLKFLKKISLDYNNVDVFENYYNYIWVRD